MVGSNFEAIGPFYGHEYVGAERRKHSLGLESSSLAWTDDGLVVS